MTDPRPVSGYRPKRVHVVSHTHWDREWYLTFHTFRVNLTRVIRKVLDALEEDGAFRHFLLDGQSIVLEDHLAIHPEDEQRIAVQVERGRLSIGPWYVLPDEFLIGAEATVRNLVIGHQIGSRFGDVQKVGYMPDSFGHVAQVPQLLRKAGIDSFVFTRGSGDEIDETGHEFEWTAPDGSTVLAINQCGGYCNGAGLGFQEIWHAHTRRELSLDRAVQQMTELFDRMGERTNGDVVLLNNGCDHFPPQQEFGRVMNALSESFPGTEFVHTDLVEFLDAVRASGVAKKRFEGELCSGKLHHILSGVWSARMYLKQRNEHAETLLARVWEPLAAYTHFAHGREYPQGLVTFAWKKLLENAPHDSICGCSIDEVHRDMIPRYDAVDQTAEQSLMHQLESLAPTFARDEADDRDTVLCVANPLPWRRDEVIDRLVVLQPFGVDPDQLTLQDESGHAIPYRVVESWCVERFWGVDYRTMLWAEQQEEKFAGYRDTFGPRILKDASERDVHDTFLRIQFVARDLPGLAHVNYRLTDRAPVSRPKPTAGRVSVSDTTLENDHVEVIVHPNGTFDLLCKATGRSHLGLNMLTDTEDVGDEYDYAPCAQTRTVTTADVSGQVEIVEQTDFAATCEVTFPFALPARIAADRKRRSSEDVECAVRVRVRITAVSPAVEVDVQFDNQAEDHRLRASFPSLIATDSLVSDGHFYANERPVDQDPPEDWCQPPPGTCPQQEFSLVQDEEGGVAILNRGLPEIEAVRGEEGRVGMELTLLRSVGWLSRDDFETRRCSNAGPTIATPEAQCLGPNRFRYAVLSYSGNWVQAGVKRASQAYRAPPMIVQGVEDQEVGGGESFLEVAGRCTAVTAIKRHETRDTLILRLYNQLPDPVVETLVLGRPVRAAWRADLLEERAEELATDGRQVCVPVRRHGITTVEIEFEERS